MWPKLVGQKEKINSYNCSVKLILPRYIKTSRDDFKWHFAHGRDVIGRLMVILGNDFVTSCHRLRSICLLSSAAQLNIVIITIFLSATVLHKSMNSGSIPVHLNRSKITGSRKRALCSVKGRISIDRKRRFAIAGRSNATNWIKVEVYTVDYITDVYNDGKLYQLHPFLLFLLAKPPTTR
jgi:hypothetical protein